MINPRMVGLAIVLAAWPATAPAQRCAGTPAFSEGRMRISFGGVFNKAATSFDFGLGMGGRTFFGDVTASNVRFEDLRAAAYAFGISGGSQFSLGRRAQICPIASVGYVAGPNDIDAVGDGSVLVNLAETDIVFGIALGAVANRSSDSPITGTVSVAFANSTLKVSEQGSNTSTKDSESFGLLAVGLGFTFSRSIGLHVGSSIPVGLEDATPSFGLSISVNFGRKG